MKKEYLPRLFVLLMIVCIAVLLTTDRAPGSNKQALSEPSDGVLLMDGNVTSPDALAAADQSESTEIILTPEPTEDLSTVAAYLVDGKSVPITSEQLADLEERIYACKSQEELDAVMAPLQYYNKGVDYARFEWFWPTLDDYYTEEQVAMMRYGTRKTITLPNFIGMTAEDAYEYSIEKNCIIRLIYVYSSSSDLPVGYVYEQDFPAGTKWTSDACIFVKLQAPRELNRTSLKWFPGTTNSDAYAAAQEVLDSGQFIILAPSVIGMQGEEAKRLLEDLGFTNVNLVYCDWGDGGYEPGYCFYEPYNYYSHYINSTAEINLLIQKETFVEIPNLVGMRESDAVEAMRPLGLQAWLSYIDSPLPGAETGYCVSQSIAAGTLSEEKYITIYIEYGTPTSTPTPTSPPTSPPPPPEETVPVTEPTVSESSGT
jgi:beta-lactam-binding protein with PASTA domain